MTEAVAAIENEEPLATLLAREFEHRSLARLGDGAAAAVPWQVFRRALYEPLHDFLTRPGKSVRTDLLLATYRAVGGKGALPVELGLFVEALHAGSLVVDDIEDDSSERRGLPALHRIYGVPAALNAGNWLYFWAFDLLDRIAMSTETRLVAQRMVTRSLRECHYGQALDLSTRVDKLDVQDVPAVVRAVSELKTGGLVALATGLAALAGGAPPEVVDASTRFGRSVGVGLQMLDDLSGIIDDRRKHKGVEDLKQAKPTWPWAWVSTSFDGRTFAELASSLTDLDIVGPPEPLLRTLRALVAPIGKDEVHQHLDRALTRFASALPGHTSLAPLRQQLDRLEKCYGQAT